MVGDWQIMPRRSTPACTLWEIAALPLRAPTAYHLWRRAHDIFRLKVAARPELRRLNVLGFGGGVRRAASSCSPSTRGIAPYFCSGHPERRGTSRAQGIAPIDQKKFNRFAAPTTCAPSERSRGSPARDGMHIVCDMLRGPVFAAGIGRPWRAKGQRQRRLAAQHANHLQLRSASVRQVTIDHTHYDTIAGCNAGHRAVRRGLPPTVHKEIYAFEDLPRAMSEMHHNAQTGIPIVRVAKKCRPPCSGSCDGGLVLADQVRAGAVPVLAARGGEEDALGRRAKPRGAKQPGRDGEVRPRAVLPLARLGGRRNRARHGPGPPDPTATTPLGRSRDRGACRTFASRCRSPTIQADRTFANSSS